MVVQLFGYAADDFDIVTTSESVFKEAFLALEGDTSKHELN